MKKISTDFLFHNVFILSSFLLKASDSECPGLLIANFPVAGIVLFSILKPNQQSYDENQGIATYLSQIISCFSKVELFSGVRFFAELGIVG